MQCFSLVVLWCNLFSIPRAPASLAAGRGLWDSLQAVCTWCLLTYMGCWISLCKGIASRFIPLSHVDMTASSLGPGMGKDTWLFKKWVLPLQLCFHSSKGKAAGLNGVAQWVLTTVNCRDLLLCLSPFLPLMYCSFSFLTTLPYMEVE